MRLARALALAGVASRRKAEVLIRDGEVQVNGQTVTDVATGVDPDKDAISVNGERVHREEKIYVILHKPRGVVSTAKDTHGRKTVLDFVPKKLRSRIYPVGRLDRESTGLMLLTNDGDLAYRLTHPKFHVEKKYRARLDKPLDEADRKRLEKGVHIKTGRTRPCRIRTQKGSHHAEIDLYEGRKRQIREMFYARGYDVKRLERTAIGSVTLKGLSHGEIRFLSDGEIRTLKKEVGLL